MKLKCYVVDDEQTSVENICRYIKSTEGLELIGYDTDEKKAMEKLLQKEIVPDILFLDIMMPHINGIEFASKLDPKTAIVFISGHETFALPAFKYGAAYLLKPLNREDFMEAIKKVRQIFEGINPQLQIRENLLLIKDGRKGSYIHIKLPDLLFIESESNYMKFMMSDGSKHLAYTSLTALEKRLSGLGFWRVHKKFIINLQFMVAIANGSIQIKDRYFIPIGQKYRDGFIDEVEKNLPE
ncbi:LytR/AlgR family response regulator transcription factor [Mucilaginibacter sp. Mucisp86]|uniref:LytR/AlgR family response regulator transcription factor n=1 Tax=Mucilaginibacter sp. Mucisp86 TaxID=3243060 RepID=UPI0039B3FDAB